MRSRYSGEFANRCRRLSLITAAYLRRSRLQQSLQRRFTPSREFRSMPNSEIVFCSSHLAQRFRLTLSDRVFLIRVLLIDRTTDKQIVLRHLSLHEICVPYVYPAPKVAMKPFRAGSVPIGPEPCCS